MALAHRNIPGVLQKHGYVELKKIGEGSFGKAILVQNKDGSKIVCKMIDVSKASHRETQTAMKEAQLLSSLKHPYIVRYRENFNDNGWFCILMDYCEGGDLTKQIDQAKRSRSHIPEEQVLRWFTQAILALKYIHDRHILHRDLKPGNFFLSKSGSLKMGDFGIAKVLSCTIAHARTQIGTPYYLSPEVCQEKPYAWGSDIWAMGCILYELCTNKVPFDAPNISGLVQKIVRGPIPTVPAPFSPFSREICAQMLNRSPTSRPSTDEILKRSQIQGIVRQMLDEIQPTQDGEGASGGDRVSRKESKESNAQAGPAGAAGGFKIGDPVEYYSSTHNDWLPATVLKIDGNGGLVIDLKPNTWISKEELPKKVRRRKPSPRGTPSNANAGGAHGQRSPSLGAVQGRQVGGPHAVPQSARRSPSAGALDKNVPQGTASPLRLRSPSAGALERPGNEAAVCVGAAVVGQRDHSQPPSRASTPRRSPSPNPPSKAAGTPRRGRDPTPRRGASPHGANRAEGGAHGANEPPHIKPPCIPRVAEQSPLRRRNPSAGAVGAAIAGA